MDPRRYVLFLMATVAVLSVTMCVKKNSDDLDDDYYAPDYWENNCEGFSLPDCGGAVNVPPVLESVTLLLNGQPLSMPATLPVTTDLALRLAFSFPNGPLVGGHVFIVKTGETMCLDREGQSFGDGAITENDTYGTEGPIDWPVDPSLFLNGEGAPYYVEISNGCGTHSNRLPLEIVTVEGE